MEFEIEIMKFEIVVNGLHAPLTAYCESESELMNILDTHRWLTVDNSLGETMTINTDAVVGFWEADE